MKSFDFPMSKNPKSFKLHLQSFPNSDHKNTLGFFVDEVYESTLMLDFFCSELSFKYWRVIDFFQKKVREMSHTEKNLTKN